MTDNTTEIDSYRVYEAHRRNYDSKGFPEWGNCIRGCPPSYLDREGFCSPACHVGAPRGEFVTAPPSPKYITSKEYLAVLMEGESYTPEGWPSR